MTVGVRSVNLWVLLNADLRGPQRGGGRRKLSRPLP